MPDCLHAAFVVDDYRHDVEAAGLLAQALGPKVALRQLAELVLLARVDAGLGRRRVLDVLARLDLDEDEGLALLRDEVYLADARADVLLEDVVPAACQEAGRLLFTLDACGFLVSIGTVHSLPCAYSNRPGCATPVKLRRCRGHGP